VESEQQFEDTGRRPRELSTGRLIPPFHLLMETESANGAALVRRCLRGVTLGGVSFHSSFLEEIVDSGINCLLAHRAKPGASLSSWSVTESHH
jgi:hypothetical protein